MTSTPPPQPPNTPQPHVPQGAPSDQVHHDAQFAGYGYSDSPFPPMFGGSLPPEPAPKNRLPLILTLIAVGLIVPLIAVFAIFKFPQPKTVKSASMPAVSAARVSESPRATSASPSATPSTYLNYLRVGDCTTLTSNFNEKTGKVDCSKPHHFEVIAEKHLVGTTAPDKATRDADAKSFCRTQFGSVVGITYDKSSYKMTFLSPSDETWAKGDRVIICIAGDSDTQLTGTVKNTKR